MRRRSPPRLAGIRRLGEEALARIEADPDGFGVVLFGRSYNAFAPEANMGIPRKFSSRGVRTLRTPVNRGKGHAVRRGMLEAGKSFVLFSDADLSTPIEELEKLAAPVLAGRAQIAFGSRAVAGSVIEVSQPFYRVAMGKTFNLMVRAIALRGFHDTQCGFKLFTRDAARELFRRQRLDGFVFDVEILVLCRELGYRVAEVPVVWNDSRPTGRPGAAAGCPLRPLHDDRSVPHRAPSNGCRRSGDGEPAVGRSRRAFGG